MRKEYVTYFDYLRLLASLCVVYMHVAARPLRGEIGFSWQLTNIFTSIGFIAVPLFLMMSGYLLLTDEKTTDISVLIKHRIPHLLVPLICWTTVSIFLYSYLFGDTSLSYFVNSFISALNKPAAVHLWFLYTLIAIYIISPVLYNGLNGLDKKGHILVFVLLAAVSFKAIIQLIVPSSIAALFELDIINKFAFFGGYLCLFVLGYYIGKSKKTVPNVILFALAFIVLGIIAIGTYLFTVRDGVYNQAFQNQAAGFEVLLAVIIFLIFKQNFNKPIKFFDVKPFVTLSFAIYFIHIPLIDIFNRTGIENNCFKHTVIITLAVFIASFLIMKTAATIKPICFITTGIPFEKACKTCNWIYTFNKIKARKQLKEQQG